MANVAPLPSPPNTYILQIDPAAHQTFIFAFPKTHPKSSICVDANFIGASHVIGVLADNGKILPHWDVPCPRAYLVIDKGYVCMGRASSSDLVKNIRTGKWKTSTVIQAGPLLVDEGKALSSTDWKKEKFRSDVFRRTSHTTIGITKKGKLIIGFFRDKSLAEVARILSKLGVKSAMNLDGGSSSHLRNGSKTLGRPNPRTELRFINARVGSLQSKSRR